ncbi:unnamed protein product, partial [Prorocentrum cordatum]
FQSTGAQRRKKPPRRASRIDALRRAMDSGWASGGPGGLRAAVPVQQRSRQEAQRRSTACPGPAWRVHTGGIPAELRPFLLVRLLADRSGSWAFAGALPRGF